MPTNRQMEARDELEAIRIRIKLIREGILEPIEGKAMGRRAPPVWAKAWGEDDKGGGGKKSADFHIPVSRPIRPKTASGMTSFHFAHQPVSKVTNATVIEGMRNKPGAAKAHGRYLEREGAIARVDIRADAGVALATKPGDVVPPEQATVPDEQRVTTISPAAEQDHYLLRDAALAIQADGSRALLTTISDDDDERAAFWDLIEQHEGTPSPDTMAFRACDNADFWERVRTRPDCPAELCEKLDGPDRDSLEPFVIDSGRAMQAFLGKQPGWVKPKSAKKRQREGLGPNMADFVIGRGGRVQYRINAALPAELTPQQNFAILRDFAAEFEKRGLPYVAVMHAPDEHNHESNWHFHLAYTDRPARRIDAADIRQLAGKGFDVSTLAPGMWDFAVTVPDPKKAGRKRRPLRRSKVPEVSRSKHWPKTLRVALAKVVNQHLEAAGVERRVSPDTYKEMGLDIESQEHLATRKNALEIRGKATNVGIENERKQWAWIQAQAKARYDAALTDVDARIARMLRSQSAGSGTEQAAEPGERVNPDKRIEELRDHLYRAAKLRYDAFIVDQEIERAKSRALKVRASNLRMLNAAKEDPDKAKPGKVKEWQELIGAATRYLQKLDEELAPEFITATRWRAEARRCEERASVIEAELLRQAEPSRPVEQGNDAGKSSPGHASEATAQSVAPTASAARSSLQAIVEAARERQRRQREADEEFNRLWQRYQREKDGSSNGGNDAASSSPEEGQASGGLERRAREKQPPQMRPWGNDIGR